MATGPLVLRVVVVGDRAYGDNKKIERVLNKLISGRGIARVMVIVLDQRGAGAHALTVCHSLGIQAITVPTMLKLGPNSRSYRDQFVLRQLKPHIVLVFSKRLDSSVEAKDFGDAAYEKGVRVYHFK